VQSGRVERIVDAAEAESPSRTCALRFVVLFSLKLAITRGANPSALVFPVVVPGSGEECRRRSACGSR